MKCTRCGAKGYRFMKAMELVFFPPLDDEGRYRGEIIRVDLSTKNVHVCTQCLKQGAKNELMATARNFMTIPKGYDRVELKLKPWT